jgi:hypothetical protein
VLELDVQPAVVPPPALAGAAWLPAQRVTLTEEWSEPGDTLAVGIPRTRTIVVEGLGLLETQLPDVLLETQPGVRQYADRPELAREVTSEGLLSRRSVSYAVIAQSPGDLTLSGARLPWWNVVEQRWEVAELPPHAISVTPSTEAEAPAPVADAVAVPPAAAPTERSLWPWISGVLALAWLVTVGAWLRTRRRAPPAAAPRPVKSDAKPALRKILRDLDAACAVNDADAARRALLAFGEIRFTANPPRSLGALAALLPESVGREVLALEAQIYGAAAGVWRGDALRGGLPELERAGLAAESAAADPLLPLYR